MKFISTNVSINVSTNCALSVDRNSLILPELQNIIIIITSLSNINPLETDPNEPPLTSACSAMSAILLKPDGFVSQKDTKTCKPQFVGVYESQIISFRKQGRA